MEVPVQAITLAGLSVESEGRCDLRPSEGAATHRVWEEARKALDAAAWTEEQEMYRFQIARRFRVLDPQTLRIQQERVQSRSGYSRSPFVSVAIEELAEHGYVRQVGDTTLFHAPDAQVLLSDHFLDTHCFRLRDGGVEGMVGLAFEPVKRTRTPDVRGVLWLEAHTAALRHLEYGYTGLRQEETNEHVGGRLEFERLPNGAWIVQRWRIRMPMQAIRMEQYGRSSVRRSVVASLREEAGEVVSIQDPAGARIRHAATGAITGTVYDSVSAAPLAGARVFLSGTSHSTTTDADGFFRLSDLPEGRYSVAYSHPRMETLETLPPPTDVHLEPGKTISVALTLSSPVVRVASPCGDVGSTAGSGTISGRVRDSETGVALPGARIVATWNGTVGRAETRTDAEGQYRLCSIPRGASLVLTTELLGYSSQQSVHLSGGTLQHDLSISIPRMVVRNQDATASGEESVRIVGRLLDAETGRPIVDAWVALEGTAHQRVTDREGRFTFEQVPSGTYPLQVRHLAYERRSEPLRVEGAKSIEVEVRLATRAIELQPLTVSVLSKEEWALRTSPTATHRLVRADIEKIEHTSRHVGDLLRGRVPGVNVREMTRLTDPRDPRPPGRILCVESLRRMVTIRTGGPGQCNSMMVVVDGTILFDPARDLLDLSPNAIESVEYLSPLQAGARYGTGSGHGVLVIYTRGNGPHAERSAPTERE